MILSEVKYDSVGRYELTYICHSCEKEIPDNRFEHCPYCGVKLIKKGRPEKLELDEGDICALIAIAITNGGFGESGLNFMQDGKAISYEGPGKMGMVWATWSRKRQNQAQKEREKQKGGAK